MVLQRRPWIACERRLREDRPLPALGEDVGGSESLSLESLPPMVSEAGSVAQSLWVSRSLPRV